MGEISGTWWIVIGIAAFFIVVISLVLGLQLVMRCNQRSRDRQMEEGIRANKILGKTREESSESSSNSTDSLDKEKENMSTMSITQLPSSRPLSAAPSFSTLPSPHTMSTIPTALSPQGYAVHPLHNAERLISKSYDSLQSSPVAGPPTTSSASVTGGPSRASSSLSKNSSPSTSPKGPKSSTSRSTASRTPSPTVVQEDPEEASTAAEPSGDEASSAVEAEAQRPVEAARSSSSSTAPRLSLPDLPRFDTGLMGAEITSGDQGKEA